MYIIIGGLNDDTCGFHWEISAKDTEASINIPES